MARPADIPVIEGIVDLQEVGRGGFAVVYRGRQAAFRRDVAVKVLQRSGLDDDDRRRFDRECQAMGALSDHPGIVTLYSAGFTAAGSPYLVMPFMEAGSLEDRIRASGPMQWQDATSLGIKLAGALETAHRVGVLHRDIKPANVLCSAYGDQLSDFGIARIQGGHETQSGIITASVAHAAPEILAGKRPSPRADVYALASTLYEVVTGRPAFLRDTDESLVPLIHRIVSEPPPDLRPLGVPDPIATVIETGMAKDEHQRYQTAEEFGRALQRAQTQLAIPLTELPIVGRPAATTPDEGDETVIVTPDAPDDGATGRPFASPVATEVVAPAAPPAEPPRPQSPPAPPVPPVSTPPPHVPDHAPLPGQSLPDGAATAASTPSKRPLLLAGAAVAIVAIVVAVLVLSGGDEPNGLVAGEGDAQPTAAQTADTAENPTTAPTAGNDVEPTAVVAPVVDVGVLRPAAVASDHPFIEGIEAAVSNAGATVAFADPAGDAAAALQGLLDAGRDPIIVLATDRTHAETQAAVAQLAANSPETRFVVVDGQVDAPNVTSLVFPTGEGSFLAGATAALASSTGRVGFLGVADDERIEQYEAGFVAGVRHVSPATQVDVRHLEAGADAAAEASLAAAMYERGADIIYGAGTEATGLFQAASAVPGRWVIGSQPGLDTATLPDNDTFFLASMTKRFERLDYDELVGAAVNTGADALAPGLIELSLADAFTDVTGDSSVFDDLVPGSIELTDDIVAGRTVVPTTVDERAVAPLDPTCPAQGCIIRILGVEPSGSELQVTLEANWQLNVGANHAHYFWSPRYRPEQVGSDSGARFATTVGDWNLSDRYPVYVTAGAVSVGNRGSDTELCVTAADGNHNVIDPALFDCVSVLDAVG